MSLTPLELLREKIIKQPSPGVTDTEKKLSELCRKSFHAPWTFQSPMFQRGKEVKELCDTLVVCGSKVLIFSDKNITYSTNKPVEVAWGRWFNAAIAASVLQLHGAERHIRARNIKLFLDAKCQIPFPDIIPEGELEIHLIAVCHGVSQHAKDYWKDASGTLVLNSALTNAQEHRVKPFEYGTLYPGKSYVHVLDEFLLEILINELTTIADFSDYLSKKQALLTSSAEVHVAGEEGLLGHYLLSKPSHGEVAPLHVIEDADTVNVYGMRPWEIWTSTEAEQKKEVRRSFIEKSYIIDGLIEALARECKPASSATLLDYSTMAGVLAEFAGLSRQARIRMALQLDRGLAEASDVKAHFQLLRFPNESTDKVFLLNIVPNRAHHELPAESPESLAALCTGAAFRARKYLERDNVTIVALQLAYDGYGVRAFAVNTATWHEKDWAAAKKLWQYRRYPKPLAGKNTPISAKAKNKKRKNKAYASSRRNRR